MTATRALEDALRPMAEMLEADGFLLTATDDDGPVVRLEVVAGPEACRDCLVPKEVFRSIAVRHLAQAGFGSEVEIRYPSDG